MSAPDHQTRPGPHWYRTLLEHRGAAPPPAMLEPICARLQAEFEPRALLVRSAISQGFDRPRVLQQFLSIHAESERSGARIIAAVAGRPEAEPVRDVMLAHADDEDRHDRMMAGLSDAVAGRSGPPVPRPDHDAENAAFLDAYDGDLAGFLCDVHVAEIRSYYFLAAYRDAARQSAAPYAGKIEACFQDILLDEENHISYTAALIGRWSATRGELVGACLDSIAHYAGMIDMKVNALRDVARQRFAPS